MSTAEAKASVVPCCVALTWPFGMLTSSMGPRHRRRAQRREGYLSILEMSFSWHPISLQKPTSKRMREKTTLIAFECCGARGGGVGKSTGVKEVGGGSVSVGDHAVKVFSRSSLRTPTRFITGGLTHFSSCWMEDIILPIDVVRGWMEVVLVVL